jgi:hypothetical protein
MAVVTHLDIDECDIEQLEAAATTFDNLVSGTHYQREAEALESLRRFCNPNDTKSKTQR